MDHHFWHMQTLYRLVWWRRSEKWRFDTKELKAEGWSWGRSSESFLGSLGPNRSEEVDEETNRWKEERKDIRGVAVTWVTLDLEVVEKAPFGDSGH